MTRFGDGLAADADLLVAAADAVGQALAPLDGRTPDLVCVFVSAIDPDDVTAVAERVAGLTGAGTVIGCSAGGVIGAGRGLEHTEAVSVWAAVLPGAHIRSFHLEVMRVDDGLAVVGLPERHPDDSACVLLADPFSFPVDTFVEGINEKMPGLPIVGGVAGGVHGSGSTRLILGGRTVDRGAVGIFLGGTVGARPVVSQGCRPIGPTMVVTAADRNVLLELAGVPAMTRLDQIIRSLPPEDQALASAGLQIGVAMDEYADEHQSGDFLIRAVLGFVPDQAGVAVGDVIEVGRTVAFQVRDAQAADADLRERLTAFRVSSGLDDVDGALLFSCNGRGEHLFTSADHDVLALREHLSTTPVAGFFAGGEIGPVGGRNHLHGFTASILAFGSGSLPERGQAG
ncbi:MAG TPA: FIST N-terminal domain-containing protein [Mycobacteriales bacterium]|nr:FIST N-terminal domain-containing protein [Mycobacteriales bacterium]